MGVPYGLLVWTVYLLSKEIFAKTTYPRALSAVAAAIGVTAVGLVSQIGITTNEIPLAILNIWALWLVVRFIRGKSSVRGIYAAAFLSGLAAGLKLTAVPYCLALFAALLMCRKQFVLPIKTILLFALCGAAGFLLADGYFLWKLYTLYENPVFPYYNQIFHSPYFDPIFVTETRFFPKTLLQWIFYPFYWAFSPNALVSEIPLQDMRFSVLLVGLFINAWRAASFGCCGLFCGRVYFMAHPIFHFALCGGVGGVERHFVGRGDLPFCSNPVVSVWVLASFFFVGVLVRSTRLAARRLF